MFVLVLYLLTLQSKGKLETGEWGGGRSTVNSERVNGQQRGNRQLTLLTVDPRGGGRSKVNSERVNSQLFYPFHEQFK